MVDRAEIMDMQPKCPKNLENLDPMLSEQFQIAVSATKIRRPELIEACKAVLVDGQVATDVAAKYSIDPAHVYRALTTIKERWDEICAEQGWDYVPLAFPRKLMKVMLEFQREQLEAYRSAGRKSKRQDQTRQRKP